MLENTREFINATGRDWVWNLISNKDLRARRFYRKYGFNRLGKGETIHVDPDTLPSSILVRRV